MTPGSYRVRPERRSAASGCCRGPKGSHGVVDRRRCARPATSAACSRRFDAAGALDQFLRPAVNTTSCSSEIRGSRAIEVSSSSAHWRRSPIRVPSRRPSRALRLHWHDAWLPLPEPQWWASTTWAYARSLDLALPAGEVRCGVQRRRVPQLAVDGRSRGSDSRGVDGTGLAHRGLRSKPDVFAPNADRMPSAAAGLVIARRRLWSRQLTHVTPSRRYCRVSNADSATATAETPTRRQRWEAAARSRNQMVSSDAGDAGGGDVVEVGALGEGLGARRPPSRRR